MGDSLLKDARELAKKTCGHDELEAVISLWTWTIKEVQRNALEHAADIVSSVGVQIHPVANSPCAQASQILRQEAEKLK